MRVLHLGKYFPPTPGGIERYSRLLLDGLHARGVGVGALVHQPAGRSAPAERPYPVWTARSAGELLHVPLGPAWPLRLAQAIGDLQPDLLHLHAPNPWCFSALALSSARRLPWIVHWHADVALDAAGPGLRLAYPAYRVAESALLQRAARIIATSARYATASRPLARHAARVRVVPLAVEAAVSSGAAPAWPADGLRVLAVGRFSHYKGFHVLIDAVARTPGTSLLLIGDGEQRARLERHAADSGAAERIRLAGALGDPAVAAAYDACNVACLPSLDRAEAFGLVLLEAMRAGRPCIASDVPGSGMGTLVLDGDTGTHVPPGDAAALAAALAAYRDDPLRRQREGLAARQRWATHFSLDASVDGVLAVYRELVAG